MKKKESYTVIWEDHLGAHYIHRLQAYDKKNAFHKWGTKFNNQTIGYNLTEEEYQAMVKGYDFFGDFIKEDVGDPSLVYSESKEQLFKNVWYDFMHYDLRGIEKPYLVIHLVKNNTSRKNHTFTFFTKYFLGSHLIQNEAPSLEVAFSQWRDEMIYKKNLEEVMPLYALQRFQRALKKQKNVHLSPVARHPGVWRWRLLVGRVPCTLYIVATDNHIQEDMMHLYEDKKTTYETK